MRAPYHAPNSGAHKRSLVEPRHLIVLACFLATLAAYVERVGFSIAYTAMAKVDKVDEATKGTVLSAFYWGYGVSQVTPQHSCMTLQEELWSCISSQLDMNERNIQHAVHVHVKLHTCSESQLGRCMRTVTLALTL